VDKALQLAEFMIISGADVNAESAKGRNVLHECLYLYQRLFFCDENDEEMKDHQQFYLRYLHILLGNGAKLCSTSGYCALSYVEYIEEAEIILRHDASQLNQSDKEGYTPLYHIIHNIGMCQARESQKNVVEYLLELGANAGDYSTTVICAWNQKHCFSVIKQLIQQSPSFDVNTKNNAGRTLFMDYFKESGAVNFLIAMGANLLITDKYGKTVIDQACGQFNVHALTN
jgi:ankyrin repeat protein